AIRVVKAERGFAVRVGVLELPLSPRALGAIVRHAAERIDPIQLDAVYAELSFVGDALVGLPSEPGVRREGDKQVLLTRLSVLCEEAPCSVALTDELVALNSDPAELDTILEAQADRLAHWSVAGEHVPCRTFFYFDSLG